MLNKVAFSIQVNMKADLREIYGASTRAAAEAAIGVFADKYRAKYEKAVACLGIALSAFANCGRAVSQPSLERRKSVRHITERRICLCLYGWP